MSAKPGQKTETDEQREERLDSKFTNIVLQLTRTHGDMTTSFSLSSPPHMFSRKLNDIIMTLDTLSEKLEPLGEVEGVVPLTKISAASGPTYQMLQSDVAILCDATAGALQVNLIQAFNSGKIIRIVKTDSSGNAVTVAALSGDTINGNPTVVLSAQYDETNLVADGNTNWLKT